MFSSWVFRFSLWRCLKKWSDCWALFATAVVFVVRVRCAAMWTPKYFKAFTVLTRTLLLNRGAVAAWVFLKSRMSSLVLAVLRVRLLHEHHSTRHRTDLHLLIVSRKMCATFNLTLMHLLKPNRG